MTCITSGAKKNSARELNSTEEVGPVKKPIVKEATENAKENI
jgi:hypothetical protein